MTADEARALLGVEPGADKSTVRRAYLRLLKQHKPETDPEGFQRLREAYELVDRFSQIAGLSTVALHQVVHTRDRDDHAETQAAPDFAPPPEPEPEPEPLQLPHALPITPAPGQVFWERLDELPPDDFKAAQRVLEEAIATCPDDPAFYLELAGVHADAESPAASVEVLRAGMARGHIACGVELLYTRPGALDLGMLERVAPRVHFGEAARGFMALDRPERAFELARDAVRMEQWSRPAFHRDVGAALDVALGLNAAGQRNLGQQLGKQTLAAGRESGAALEAAREGGLRWVLCGEFFALTPPLPVDIDAALATSILRGNALSYRFAWEELGRQERRALDERLGREAPMLHQFVGSAGADAPSFWETLTEGTGSWWVWPLAVFVLHLLRSCTDCGGGNRPLDIDRYVADQRAAERVLVGQGGETPLSDAAIERQAREATAEACAQPASPDCERASIVLAAWQRGDCVALLAPLDPLTATHELHTDAGPEVIFGPPLPPPLAELVRRCEEQDRETP